MKAPETIFLHGYSFDDEPCKNWTLEPLKRGLRGHQIQCAKYISKDALLEWARDNRDNAGKLSYTEFIDKIESL